MNYTRKRMLSHRYGEEPIECMVEIVIDTEALADIMGRRALRNKSKRSRFLSGLITATVRETMASKGKREPLETC